MDIQVLKLSTGEELLAEVLLTEDRETTIQNPLAIGMDQAGKMIAMPYAPYTFSKNNGVKINKSQIVYQQEPASDIKKAYTNYHSQHISGIITANV